MGAPVQIGDVLAEKYEVTRILGQGGMGVVVAARHRELDKLVALKFMHEEVAKNEQATDRFLREARAAARLQNEHVGRVLDVGRMQGGIPYIVMEYLEGRDLSELLEERGQLEVADTCEYLLQVCEAMAEAHTQGIIHRDLKPQNLFLTTRQDGRPLVKVLDFGISKAQFAQGPTATHATMGSPAYMSPEQMRSARSVDPRADIWSLGVILYQLLSNSLPFVGETITETMLKVMSDPLPPLSAVRPGLPPALVAAIEKCLEKDRDQRFDNVAELAHELTPYAPERARAAMSLIERVMSAGVSHSTHRATYDADDVVPSVSTVAPAVTVPPAASSHKASVAHVQTTLGTAAAQSIDIEPRPRTGNRRWLALFVVGIVAAVGVTALVMRGGGETMKPASGPERVDANTAVAAPDAAVAKPDPVPDAAVALVHDAALHAVDATEKPKPPTVVQRKPDAAVVAVPPPPADAATTPQPPADARELKPVEEKPLKPAGEGP